MHTCINKNVVIGQTCMMQSVEVFPWRLRNRDWKDHVVHTVIKMQTVWTLYTHGEQILLTLWQVIWTSVSIPNQSASLYASLIRQQSYTDRLKESKSDAFVCKIRRRANQKLLLLKLEQDYIHTHIYVKYAYIYMYYVYIINIIYILHSSIWTRLNWRPHGPDVLI